MHANVQDVFLRHPVYTDGSAQDGFRDGEAGFVVIKGDLGADESSTLPT